MVDLIQSVARAIQILEAFNQGKDNLTLTEIAHAVDLPKSTTSRLLDTLIHFGYITEDYKRYRLGIKMFILGNLAASNNDFHRTVRPVMEKLAEDTHEMVDLNIIVNGQRLCIDKIESKHSVRNYIPLGQLLPACFGASGKVLLAFLTDVEVRGILNSEQYQQYLNEKNLNRKKEEFLDSVIYELQEIRKNGWAFTKNERIAGAWAASAPIRDYTGRVIASLSIGGPSSLLAEEMVPQYIQSIVKASEEASLKLGHNPRIT